MGLYVIPILGIRGIRLFGDITKLRVFWGWEMGVGGSKWVFGHKIVMQLRI